MRYASSAVPSLIAAFAAEADPIENYYGNTLVAKHADGGVNTRQ